MNRAKLTFHSVDYEKGIVYFSFYNFLYCFRCKREHYFSSGYDIGFGRSSRDGNPAEMIPRNPTLERFDVEPPPLCQPIPAPLRALFHALNRKFVAPLARQNLVFPYWLEQIENELGPQKFPELLYQQYFGRGWRSWGYTRPAEAIAAERQAETRIKDNLQ